MRRLWTCSLVGIIINGATGSAGSCFFLISTIATLLVMWVCWDSYLSMDTSGTRLRSTARRTNCTMITRATSHGCLAWRVCRTIYSAGLMTPLIKLVCHYWALQAISLAHHAECSTSNAQESVYSGWKSLHGIKVEKVLLPSGMSTVFGPVSVRQNNRGTLNLSGLGRFLALIQASLPPHCRCMLFGDSIFCGLLQYITTYYRALVPKVLTAKEVKINASFRAAWMPIEKNYGLTNCVFRICDTTRGYQLAKQHPYALEQLRVSHLLINCYICLNGDQVSSVNTFNCPLPCIDDYLRL
jgi:hypothetical protein